MPIKQNAIRRGSPKPPPPFNPNPDKGSERSKRRQNRGFVSLEQSSRKHRRANSRLLISRTINGRLYPAGEPVDAAYSSDDFVHHAGGKMNYH